MSNMEEKVDNHPWWHEIFETLYRTKQLRDGFLGSLTPDVDYNYYRCNWFRCKWHKEERIIVK